MTGEMTFESPDQLNASSNLFYDPERPSSENQGPYLLVLDNFYADAEKVRSNALQQEFYQYSPPLKEQVGSEVAGRFTASDPRWFSTSLMRFQGRPVNNPQPGYRYAGSDVVARLAELTGEKPDSITWATLGDGWNGAFHLHFAGKPGTGFSVHHHYKKGDVYPRGWSGVVYLSPDAPSSSGTTIWMDKENGKCIAQEGAIFSKKMSRFEKVMTVENRFNRLVLFRENVLHRAEPGFGDSPETGRLTQTFFFLAL